MGSNLLASVDWERQESWASPSAQHVAVEVYNVGGCLTHGDLALEAGVDFHAVVEHRLIPSQVRSEWAWLRGKGLASIWALACQDSSHVGNAGVGVGRTPSHETFSQHFHPCAHITLWLKVSHDVCA